MREELGAARHRPSDVVGAATCAPLPAGFEDATQAGAEVERLLR